MTLPRRSLTSDIGASGLDLKSYWGGAPDDFIDAFQTTAKKVKSIKEMLYNSPVIGALRLAIEMPIRAVDWYFESDDGDDDPRLEFLDEALENLSHSWNDHIVEALTFPFYGWSMFSVTYERVGGRLLWRKFKTLGQDTVYRWEIADDGGIVGLWQNPWQNPDMVPVERMLIYRFRRNRNNPEGESVLRPAWIPWYYAKNMQQIEAIGVERNLNGMPVITPPMGADMTESTSESTDYGRAHAIIRNVRQDQQAGVVLPAPLGDGEHQRWKLELMSGGGMSKVIDTDIIIARYEKRILMSSLAQFLILGQDKVGALSLSSDQTDFFTLSVNSVADIIAETFSKFAVPRLMKLNGMDDEGLRLAHSPAGDIDTIGLSDALQKLAPNITWGPQDEVWLRSVLKLPEKTEEQITTEKAEKQAMMPQAPAAPPLFGRPMVDNAAAQFFAAGDVPGEEVRTRLEKRFERGMRKVFGDQRERVLKGARRIGR